MILFPFTLPSGCAIAPAPVVPQDSGGPLLAEQAAYDVLFYDLKVEIFPESRSIEGVVEVHARVGEPLSWFVLDLDHHLDIRFVKIVKTDGLVSVDDWDRRGGRLWIPLRPGSRPGDDLVVQVAYGGVPMEAANPPWSGGLTWSSTPAGDPWIATTCEGEGADVWWPVKDHVSDEPESMEIHVTVPAGLVVASNGRLDSVEEHEDGRSTFHWRVSTPINNYNVALNIAPYKLIEREYTSVTGETIPIVFYALPDDVERAEQFLPEVLDHLRFHEELLGPYPFRADKYGVVQTPHLGMEHQTIVAYGAGFDNSAMTGGKDWGFDALHHHELAHEWWGNLVTNVDWSDLWIHEGFATYMQCLYVERKDGRKAYVDYLESLRHALRNQSPVAPRRPATARESFQRDVYVKGAWILHTLRYLLGDDTFFLFLRRAAYPDPDLERVTDGRQCRFATTDDLLPILEQLSGMELDWFFEVYLRNAALPRLNVERREESLELTWRTSGDLPFPMPIDVRVGDTMRRVDVTRGGAVVAVPAGASIEVDPEVWVLRDVTTGDF